MTLKLTAEQAEALFKLLQIVIENKPADAESKLVIMLLIKVFRKLRAKIEARLPRGYSLTLTPEEALAYYAYFQSVTLPATMIYELNFITAHNAQINKQLL
jgi:hypothetical protein